MMLQEAASAEASAGLHGRKAVRISALRALRLLYEAVNDAQALSYVLPGAVGGLSKALLQGPLRLKVMAYLCHVALLPLVNMWGSPCWRLTGQNSKTAVGRAVASSSSLQINMSVLQGQQ